MLLAPWAVCRLVCRLVCRSLGPRRGRRGPRTTQDQLSMPLRPPVWWADGQQMLQADLAAWEALRDQAAGTASTALTLTLTLT